jgi:hypothetical protein
MTLRAALRVVTGALIGALLVVTPAGIASGSGSASASRSAVATGGSSPSSCPARSLIQTKQVLETDLAARVTRLDSLIGRVNRAATLTSSDKAALLGDLTQNELPGIEDLQSKVARDTSAAQLRQDCHWMFADYRVYVVMTPKTDLVITIDAATNAEGVLASLESVISGQIERAQAQGEAVSSEQAAFADYQADVAAAQNLTSGQSATLLAQTPMGWPGNRSVFLRAGTHLSEARKDLRRARTEQAEIVRDLSSSSS